MLQLIFSSNTQIGKKIKAYGQAFEGKLHTVDIAKTKLGNSQWAQIAADLGVSVGDLIDKTKLSIDNASDLDTDDWLKILQKDDTVLRSPIAIKGSEIRQIEQTTEIFSFFGVDSAGIEKTLHYEPPTTESKTKGENFK